MSEIVGSGKAPVISPAEKVSNPFTSSCNKNVEAEIASADRERADRRKEALLLVSFNLAKLNLHVTTSRRILNDLRTLRRLLLAERGLPAGETTAAAAGD